MPVSKKSFPDILKDFPMICTPPFTVVAATGCRRSDTTQTRLWRGERIKMERPSHLHGPYQENKFYQRWNTLTFVIPASDLFRFIKDSRLDALASLYLF